MKIPIPYQFGEYGQCDNKLLKFTGVSWFHWSTGYEYTYFFATGNRWTGSTFYTSDGKECTEFLDVDEGLLEDKSFAEHGFPLRGTGYVSGIRETDGKLYTNVILTSHYLTHLDVQCDEHGRYPKNGEIIFPPTPSFETTEKRQKVLLKKYAHLAE